MCINNKHIIEACMKHAVSWQFQAYPRQIKQSKIRQINKYTDVFFRPIKQKALFFCSKLSSRLRNHSKFLSKGADFEFLIVPDRTVQGISGDYAKG